MNFLQLLIKQMRQRALSTTLTLLSVLLGVSLAIAILIFNREGEKLFGQSDYGYDLVIGAKGSKLQLVLNTTYHLSASPGNIPYNLYESLPTRFPGAVRWAVPLAVGDNYQGHRIIGTTQAMFPADADGKAFPAEGVFEYRLDRPFELAQGRVFRMKTFEAVIGAEVAQKTGLKLGGKFKGTHGLAATGLPTEDEHHEQWTVVGILKPTHTANDRVLFIPLESFYAIPAHESALEAMAEAGHAEHARHEHEEAYDLNADGSIDLKLDRSKWKLSAILVRSRGAFANQTITWTLNNSPDAMAANPASEMRDFFNTFLRSSSQLLLLVSMLVTVVAAVSILVSIYNSVSARRKEIAILRALGATRLRVLVLICSEAGLIGLAGGLIGLVVGHALAAGASVYLQAVLGEGIRWFTFSPWEGVYVVMVGVLSVAAGLTPAVKAYSTPVATNLVAG